MAENLIRSGQEDMSVLPSSASSEKDWLVARQTLLNSENNGYLVTLGVILSSYAAALLLGAGWILSGTLISSSPDLQVGHLVARYPNAAIAILIFGSVSAIYHNATTVIGYLYLENRLELMVLDFRLMALSCSDLGDINDLLSLKSPNDIRVLIAAPLVIFGTGIPFLASVIIVLRFIEWLQNIQAFSWPIMALFFINWLLVLVSILIFCVAANELKKKNKRCWNSSERMWMTRSKRGL